MSSALPSGMPSAMSNRTMSPSSRIAARWARVPPIIPAPISAIFLRAMRLLCPLLFVLRAPRPGAAGMGAPLDRTYRGGQGDEPGSSGAVHCADRYGAIHEKPHPRGQRCCLRHRRPRSCRARARVNRKQAQKAAHAHQGRPAHKNGHATLGHSADTPYGYGVAGCPPGLAKKPMCMPPGQYKKQFEVGQRVPLGYNGLLGYNALPYDVRSRYGAALDPRSRYIYDNNYLYRRRSDDDAGPADPWARSSARASAGLPLRFGRARRRRSGQARRRGVEHVFGIVERSASSSARRGRTSATGQEQAQKRAGRQVTASGP